jgi:hypothetical protein
MILASEVSVGLFELKSNEAALNLRQLDTYPWYVTMTSLYSSGEWNKQSDMSEIWEIPRNIYLKKNLQQNLVDTEQ